MRALAAVADYFGVDTGRTAKGKPDGALRAELCDAAFVSPVLVPSDAGRPSVVPLTSHGPPTLEAHAGHTFAFEVRAASVAGSRHRVNGTPREDAFIVRPAPDGGLVAAVADGLGDPRAAYSWLGARLACEVATHLILEHWQVQRSVPIAIDLQKLDRLMIERSKLPASDESPALALATTLTCLALSSSGAFSLFQVGDSKALTLTHGLWKVLGQYNDSTVVNDPTDSLPKPRQGVKVSTGQLDQQMNSLVLATDGLSDPMLDARVSARFSEWWRSPPEIELFVAQLSFEKKSESDDRTGIAIWPRRAPVK